VDRRVNVGQTVVASLTAPSLFLIAKDLTRLQVWASVNEADIGQIHQGQRVRFTVDAFPNETFVGEVTQIRLNATMTQNVVTYTVVVATDNSSGRLLPYLTANLNFEVEAKEHVLLVPNGALRFQPRQGTIAAEGDGAGAKSRGSRNQGRIWIREGDRPKAIDVVVGLSDGTLTEVQSQEIQEGSEILVGEVVRTDSDSQSSPFAPKLFGGRGTR
jgi:HlyD family secretion protein